MNWTSYSSDNKGRRGISFMKPKYHSKQPSTFPEALVLLLQDSKITRSVFKYVHVLVVLFPNPNSLQNTNTLSHHLCSLEINVSSEGEKVLNFL